MANSKLSISARNEIAKVYTNLIDSGGEPGTISFYTGPQPENSDTTRLTRGQVLLAKLEFAYPCASEPEDGSIEFAPSQQAIINANGKKNAAGKLPWIVESDEAIDSGKIEWARVQDSDGNVIFDCDVSEPGNGGFLEINSVNVVKGGVLRMKNLTLVIPQ